ncbi:ATP-binding protein [Bremerella cremea]|uniref:ATP-binding protein n=1 Tax=Bremerella cremea TaxID=1031537 RepID=UPI0031ECD038
MTLVDRVSAFFLAALAVCLVTLSAVMYLVIEHYIYARFDGQLRGSLHVLAAVIEAEEDSIKWQPLEHAIELWRDQAPEDIRWVLVGEKGQVIDQTTHHHGPHEIDADLLSLAHTRMATANDPIEIGKWRCLQEEIVALDPLPESEREEDDFERILVTVARPAKQLEVDMFRLGVLFTLLPLVMWIVAALLGRAFCRRALRPVHDIAKQAHRIKPNDFSSRLPVSPQRDELADMAEAFNGLLDRLEQSFLRQQAFAGDAAHQLKTPLTALRGQIDVALLRSRSPEEYQRTLQTLCEQTLQLQHIIEALLMLARDDQEEPDDWQSVELGEWFASYRAKWSNHARAGDLHWPSVAEWSVPTSPGLLQVVLDNFLENAFKFSPDGTPIEITCHPQRDHVEISVINEGGSIQAEDQERIFEPFYRSETARRQGIAGTGLGLAMVARIARRLHGDVRVDSPNESKSRFTLQIPS